MATWYPRTRRMKNCFTRPAYAPAFRKSFMSSSRSRSNDALYAAGSAKTTSSPLVARASCSVRTISRRRRFTRFRSTAECECRGTMMPMRCGVVAMAVERTSSSAPRVRLPFARTAARPAPLVSRSARGKRSRLRSGVLRRQLHCQELTPLLAAPAQYLPPPLRGHAKTEPVLPDSFLVSWVVRRLSHHYSWRSRNQFSRSS